MSARSLPFVPSPEDTRAIAPRDVGDRRVVRSMHIICERQPEAKKVPFYFKVSPTPTPSSTTSAPNASSRRCSAARSSRAKRWLRA